MSDEEADIVNEDLEVLVVPTKPEKQKRIMTESQLEKLKLAREKAALVKRAARAAKTEKENEIKEKVKKEQLEKMEKKVRNSMIDLSVDEKPAKPNKPKKKVVVMHDSGSDSDSETQVIYIPRRSNKSSKSKEAPSPEKQPLAAFGQMGQIPRYQLHNFNHNRHFY